MNSVMNSVWLEYALSSRQSGLVHVSEADTSGGYTCPYCGEGVIARQGRRNAWHFAHSGDTCHSVRAKRVLPLLPLYYDFYHLTPTEMAALRRIYKVGYGDKRATGRLESGGFIAWNPYRGRMGSYDVTRKGEICLGTLSLPLFAAVQADEIRIMREKLKRETEQMRSIDLMLYEAQIARLHEASLYFLQVTGHVYKIGITSRPLETRLSEIARDIKPYLSDSEIKPLGVWQHAGRLERYWKYRYRHSQYRLGSLTEYYWFNDVAPVLRELKRLNLKIEVQ